MSEYNLMWIQIQIWIQLISLGFIWYRFRLDWIKGGVGPWWRYALIFNTDLTSCTVLRMYCRICSAHAEFLYLDLTLADPRAAICPPACQQRSYCWKHCPCCHQRVTALRGPVPPFNLPAVWREAVQFTKTQSWNTWFSVLCLWRVWEYDTHLLQNEFLIFCLLKRKKTNFPHFHLILLFLESLFQTGNCEHISLLLHSYSYHSLLLFGCSDSGSPRIISAAIHFLKTLSHPSK